jgi:hypothetical protein
MLRSAVLAFAVAALGAAFYVLTAAPEVDSDAVAEKRHAKRKARSQKKEAPPLDEDDPMDEPIQWKTMPRVAGRPEAPPPPPAPEPNRVRNQDEAVQIYEGLLAELADIEGSGKELSQREKAKLYRDSSTVLAGLSEQFNLEDPEQRAYFDGARGTIMAQLRRMKIGPPDPYRRKPPELKGSPGQY